MITIEVPLLTEDEREVLCLELAIGGIAYMFQVVPTVLDWKAIARVEQDGKSFFICVKKEGFN